ncbi:MAG: response regulator transcription factor [Methylovulum sp.]|nr:response regulator transcription factor [Methylovulum sp.]
MINLLIADDHATIREGVKKIIAEIPDMQVCGEAASGDEAFNKIRANGWDVLLLDISMPGRNVLDLVGLAKRQSPHLPVLIFSMYPEDQYAIRMLKAGADGYVTKDSSPDELVTAIRKVAGGRKYISAAVAENLIDELKMDKNIPSHAKLSDREFQVFLAIAAGKSICEIANDMTLSAKTVSTFKTRLMSKMQMDSNADIIRYALQNNFTELPLNIR